MARHLMTVLRSILYALIFYPGSLLYVMTAILVSPFGTGPVRAVSNAWSQFQYEMLDQLLGIRFEWDGEIPHGAYLIAVKHQSMVEAIDTLRFARTPLVVMKRELTTMPLFGKVTRLYGVVGVDRDAGAKALREMMAMGKQAAAEGRPVIIFPEGTRVPYGERPPLRAGFAGLYRALGLPVVPVAVDSGRVWPRGKFIKQTDTVIHFKVGETIPPGLKRDEVEARVHAAINSLNP